MTGLGLQYLIWPVLMPIAFGIVLSIIGTIIERKHEENLDAREAAIGHFLLVDTKTVPNGLVAEGAAFVSGSVVIGSGYLKQLTASLRTLVGGEVKGYQRVLDRGRREAQLRMVESARRQGAQAIINVRFETADVGGQKPFSEVFCYGTMIR